MFFRAAGQVVLMQMTYGATILAFLGAPHWGFAISEFKRADLPTLTSSFVFPPPRHPNRVSSANFIDSEQ
jgi:hypothetical protein